MTLRQKILVMEAFERGEEIHHLKTQMTGYSMMFDEPQDAIYKEDKWPS